MVQALNVRGKVVATTTAITTRIVAAVQAELKIAKPKEYITKGAYQFVVHASFASLDKSKIMALLEKSFGKKLTEGYFEGAVAEVVIEKDYKAVAIIKTINGMAYLDKIAVSPELQGNGVGKALWETLKEKYGSFMWRAAKTNDKANSWYFKACDGMQKMAEWNIFWVGVPTETAAASIDTIAALPPTLIK